VLVVQQNWFRGVVNELHVVVIVSQVPVFVCKQLRKNCNDLNQAAFTRRRSETIQLGTISRSFIDFTSGRKVTSLAIASNLFVFLVTVLVL